METIVKRLYEAMILVDSAKAASDWDGLIGTIEAILKKAEAEIVSIRKWDERRLAYEIEKKGRGTYILCYFRSAGDRISGIEREVQLSEQIMRVLILNAEHLTDEDVEKERAAVVMAEKKTEDAALRAQQRKEEAAAVNTTETASRTNSDESTDAEAEPEAGDETKTAVDEAGKLEVSEGDAKADESALESQEEEIN